MSIDAVVVLKAKGLHITDARQNILATFYKKQGNFTQKDIHLLSGKVFDRVTIYRTLELFVAKGIIHIIPSMDHVMRYALIKDTEGGNCYQNHLHFLCEDCGKTFWLNPVGGVMRSFAAISQTTLQQQQKFEQEVMAYRLKKLKHIYENQIFQTHFTKKDFKAMPKFSATNNNLSITKYLLPVLLFAGLALIGIIFIKRTSEQ